MIKRRVLTIPLDNKVKRKESEMVENISNLPEIWECCWLWMKPNIMGAKETVGTALRSSLEKRKIEGKM